MDLLAHKLQKKMKKSGSMGTGIMHKFSKSLQINRWIELMPSLLSIHHTETYS